MTRCADLIGGDLSAGVALHDSRDDAGDTGAVVAAPEEVVAGGFDEELVLARGDWGVDEGFGVVDVDVGRGGGEAGLNGLVHPEHKEDEEEGGEELEGGGLLVAP